jgi:phosphomannomutase
MNDIVVLQTCQGLIRYLDTTFGETMARESGIVVGYDHRATESGALSSSGFAKITAAVFASQGYKVNILENLVATPLVAYAVTHLRCVCGIMVTASHNPKQDDGYKVYWANGSQIIPPHDTGIARCIDENLQPWQSYDVSDNVLYANANVHRVTDLVAENYFTDVKRLSHHSNEHKSKEAKYMLNITYTAMHGVGHQWILRSFAAFNLPPPKHVVCQCSPDPMFPTVSFPNPEEKGALDEAIKYANSIGSGLIIANDPDADRLAVAERLPDGPGRQMAPKWHVFSGNEIGVLLGHWQITKWRANGGADGAALLASVVSSRMLKHIAKCENMQYHDTLTGFKWLGNKTIELRDMGVPVLFSYEEALGFCVGDVVCDKDGVSAAAVFAEMANVLDQQDTTVHQHLNLLFEKYGHFISYNNYVICRDPRKTDAIFHRIRTGGPSGSYFTNVCGANVVAVKDVTLGYDSANTANDCKCDLPLTPDSHMLMFEFDNGVSATFRTSGTEPKIKFYTEIAGRPGQDAEELQSTIHTFVDALVEEFIQPKANGLV